MSTLCPPAASLPPSWPRPEALPRPLRLALGASLAFHALALLWQQLPQTPPELPPRALSVRLLTQAPPEPAVQPAAAAPEQASTAAPSLPVPPTRRESAPRLPVLTRSAPDHTAAAVSPNPSPAASTPSEAPPLAVPTPSATESRPLAVATPSTSPATPAAVAPSEEPLDPALLERYGRSLSSLFARQQNYPRLAAMRGWEGEVQLRITIARKGNIVATQVLRSSGYEILDQNAIQLVTGSGPLPRPPEHLQNREFQLIVPVLFRLDKSS